MNPSDDALATTIELLTRFTQGEEYLLDLLIKRSLPRLTRWAHGRLPASVRSLLDTQDLVQDAVVGALPRLKSFEPHPGALQAYLRQAVANQIRNEVYKARKRGASTGLSTDLLDPASSSSPLDLAVGSEALERYEAALERLRPMDREAIVARIELQQSYEEVAAALAKPSASAARISVKRALRRLAEEMSTVAEPHPRAEARVSQKAEQALLGVTSAIADAESISWDEIQGLPFDEEHRQQLRQLRIVGDVAQENRFRMERLTGRADLGREEPEVPTLKWGRFVLRRRIGEGAFAEVYEAHDPSIDARVALKLFWPVNAERDSSSRALREARQLARVRHPNVVAVHEVSTHGGRVGFSLEFIDGHTLKEQVEVQGRFTADEATLVGKEVCSALTAVHSAGLIHRDVKAQNVMRSTDGRVILMDFGASELLDSPTFASRPQGTPLYLAPELFERGPATIPSDIYSVGVLLYYLVTASYPVQATSFDGLVAAHRRAERRQLAVERPDLPSAFVAVVERALEKDPAGRYQSAPEMLQALNDSMLQRAEAPSLSDQTQAMITRLNARAYFSVQGRLLRSPQSRPSALTMFTIPPNENAAPQVMQILTRTVADDEILARALAEATVASFGCELERGLLGESRCRFSRIGEFTLVPAGPTMDVEFVAEASLVTGLVQGQQIDDPLLAHALQQAAFADRGEVLSVGADITRRMFAAAEELIAELGIQGIGRALYWAFVAAIHRNLEGDSTASLPYVGTFQLRSGELTFNADPVFIRIIAENIG